ncbi:glyoxylate/hydroxypyruvate reductase HPR3-like [Amaranthus tricolor]|uniref:glyoxylate/hydroxypyruvate reductase HPR3-like n=1 Tax=Amaranthus tricolor TaxID=29722 RepID=UPI002583397E|nr:glyoxylate/hydroxypyruvate reductase HPR3-like [Amaranthus tricolor]
MALSTSINLPKVLLLRPPPIYLLYEPLFCLHFNFLKAYESQLPLPDFLAASSATNISAMFVTNLGPKITADNILNYLPSLRCIVTSTIGVDFVDLDECRRRQITVANAADVFSRDCADTAIALLFDVLRRISEADRFVRGGNWSASTFPLGHRIGSRKIGIVGLGSIGSRIAKRLAAFNCSISYTSRKCKPSVPYSFYSDIKDLAKNSDVLVLCCPLTDETRHMINREVLLALGKEGVIINVARGSVVDENELVKCLLEGQIAGAGLDVFDNEPSVPKELLDLDNVVLTPHLAACTEEAFEDLFEHVKGNLLAFFSNKPLRSPII